MRSETVDDDLQVAREFADEANGYIGSLRRALVDDEHVDVREVFRLFHAIKGTAGFCGFPQVETLAHATEMLLGGLRESGEPPSARQHNALETAVETIARMTRDLALVGNTQRAPESLIVELHNLSSPGGDNARRRVAPASPRPERLALPSLGQLAGSSQPHAVDSLPHASGDDPRGDGLPAGLLPDSQLLSASSPVRINSLHGLEGHGLHAGALPSTRRARAKLDLLRALRDDLRQTSTELSGLVSARDDSALQACNARLQAACLRFEEIDLEVPHKSLGTVLSRAKANALDVASRLGKEVNVTTVGEDIRVPEHVATALSTALLHAARNAVDHGLESPDERAELGKPRVGKLDITASVQDGRTLRLRIEDDGRGLDLDAIAQRAIEQGLIRADSLYATRDELRASLIFRPGVSTAKGISTISGMGVGLDALQHVVEQAGGSIDMTTQKGKGTCFILSFDEAGAPDGPLSPRRPVPPAAR